MKDIDSERLDVAHAAVERLLNGLKKTKTLRDEELRRMRLVEAAIHHLEAARRL